MRSAERYRIQRSISTQVKRGEQRPDQDLLVNSRNGPRSTQLTELARCMHGSLPILLQQQVLRVP